MEDFTKMIEAYRWRGGDSFKKKHRDFCASLCASPAVVATPCSAEAGEAGRSCTEPFHHVHIQSEPKSCVSDDDGDVGSEETLHRPLPFSTGSYKHILKKKPRASLRSRSSRQLVFSIEDMNAHEGRVKSKVKIGKETKKKSRQPQTNQSGAKAPSKQGAIEDCNMPEIFDGSACEDGPTEFRSPEVAYSPGVVSQPSHFKLANTPTSNKTKRRSSTASNHVTRHVLMNDKSPFSAHAKRTPKPNDVKKINVLMNGKSPFFAHANQTPKSNDFPSQQGPREDCNIADRYDSSACEDNPADFTSPEVAYSTGVVSQPAHFELANKSASHKRKRRSKHVTRHVLINGKSPFFAHDLKTIKKTLPNTLITKPENETAAVKTYTRIRKKVSPVSSNDVGIIEIDESSGHLRESSDWKDAGDQSAYASREALNSGVLSSKATSKSKTSAYFTIPVKALGQRDIVNKTWIPPISVHALIQEELYQDPWKVLVACMLLNKTSGAQMRKVIWDLFALCPTPEAAVAVETDKVEKVIRPLGLQKKRARMIQKFSKDYLGKEWVNVGELHGIGKYAIDAYAIFCEGRWREVKPEDHKLVDYWQYLCATDGLGYAFKDDREKGREVVFPVSQQAES